MSTIEIEKGAVTTNFLYFFDTKTRITSELRSPHRARADAASNEDFRERIVGRSIVLKSFFSELIPGSFIHIHFHNQVALASSIGTNRCEIFSLPETDWDVGYSPIECTFFRNGILAVLIRLQNTGAPIEDRKYLSFIRSPEKSDPSNWTDVDAPQESGTLVLTANAILRRLEPKLINFINSLDETSDEPGINCTSLNNSEPMRLHLLPFEPKRVSDTEAINNKETRIALIDDEAGTPSERLGHRLQSSRPHVGTVIQFRSNDAAASMRRWYNLASGEKNTSDSFDMEIAGGEDIDLDYLRRFAVSCARADPNLIDNFTDTSRYFDEEVPRRDIIHTGPSIFLISRRNWCCFNIQNLDASGETVTTRGASNALTNGEDAFRNFRTGVVETVLIALEAMQASVRAHRRFLLEVTSMGSDHAKAIDTQMSREADNHYPGLWKLLNPFRTVQSIRYIRNRNRNSRELRKSIVEFTAFLSRIRSNSPVDEISLLLPSHLLTHTAIAAIQRIKHLSSHQTLSTNTLETIGNYESFLATIDEYWNLSNHQNARITLILTILVFFLSAFAVFLAAAGLAFPNGGALNFLTGIWLEIGQFLENFIGPATEPGPPVIAPSPR